jgi:hypothetical protein
MLTDANLALVPYGGSGLSLVGVASAPSPSVIDILGQGVGTAPQNIWGNTTVFGQADAMGVGAKRMDLNIATGNSAFVGAGVSLNVQWQAAVDAGVGSNYQPGTWNVLGESGAIAVGNLTANTVIARLPFLPPFPANLRPRYLRLNFVMTGGLFTTGVIAFALPVLVRDDEFQRYAARNYTV